MQNCRKLENQQSEAQQEPQSQSSFQNYLQNTKYYKNYTKEEIALLFSYLNSNIYFQNLKKTKKYIHWMSTQQKKQLLNHSFTFLAKKQIQSEIYQLKKFIKSHPISPISIKIVVIILYGKLQYKGQTYQVGNTLEISEQVISQIIEEKCVCLLFEKNMFECKINILNQFHFKKQCFKMYFLQKISVQLPQKKIDQIVQKAVLYKKTSKNLLLNQHIQKFTAGIFILIEGDFQIIQRQTKNIVGQTSQNYFGEESFWGCYEYTLKTKQTQSLYLFCEKENLQSVLMPQKSHDIQQRLRLLYDQKQRIRQKVCQSQWKRKLEIIRSKQKIKKINKTPRNIEQCKQTLEKVKKQKPKWQSEAETKQAKIKNKRKNIFTEQSSSIITTRRKYFSLRIAKDNTKYQKQLTKRHFSQTKLSGQKTINESVLPKDQSKEELNVTLKSNTFSKFAKTTFFSRLNDPSISFLSGEKAKVKEKLIHSQSYNEIPLKKQRTNASFDKWDLQYSKRYDRTLSRSVQNEDHYQKIQKLKNKIFPKQKAQFFNLKDADQALNTTFYKLQKLRKEQADEKNKRGFQQIFKQKMLLLDAARKNPFTFR